METSNALKFKEITETLLDQRGNSDLQQELSGLLEYACGSLFHEIRKGTWYDGVVGMQFSKRKQRQLEITGQIWVAQDSTKQRLEPFFARVTDKSVTKQGIWLKVKIGEYEAEGELRNVL